MSRRIMKNKALFIEECKNTTQIAFSAVLYAIAINLFVVPADIYCGGILGICQVIRTLLTEYAGLKINFDIASLLYYIVNIPIMLYAWFKISRGFLIRSLLCLTIMTIAMSAVPIKGLLPDDRLASCVIGGLISGAATGYYLRRGASGGGFDVIGLALVRSKKGEGVGKINLMVNVVLFITCGFLFSVDVVIYSIIFSGVYGIVVDRVHTRNVNVEVKIVTKCNSGELEKAIMNELGRGVTEWNAVGAYTDKESRVLYVISSKYELPRLKYLANKYDSNAFIVVNENVRVFGNFLKKL